MTRRQRLQSIIDIVGKNKIKNQAELAQTLRKMGHKITQPTLSRDIAELGLVKSQAGYSLPDHIDQPSISQAEFSSAMRKFVIGVFVSNNLIMIKTFTGSANFVGYVVDHAGWEDFIGSIAGEDAVIVMTKTNKSATYIGNEIKKIINS